jgi:hypothetical protein
LRKDDFYLEKIAREELNMVRPGEVVYHFRSVPSEDKKSRAISDAAAGSRPSAARKPPR